MKDVKRCKNCEFNLGGICGEDGVYGYGNKITDDTKSCDCWGPDFDFLKNAFYDAPRFLREALNDNTISSSEFISQINDYNAGKSISINFFDAIKMIYGISMVDIAVVLNVSFGVVYTAKTKKFSPKRLNQFSKELHLVPEVLLNTTTADFDYIKKASSIFWFQEDIKKKLESMPGWKCDLANMISMYLNCPIDLAEKFSRVDKMHWSSKMSLDDFTESEQALIKYIICCYEKVYEIDYFLDLGCKPHINISIKKN